MIGDGPQTRTRILDGKFKDEGIVRTSTAARRAIGRKGGFALPTGCHATSPLREKY